MKVALISDIHGNLPALQAVLRDIPEDVTEVWCLGDLIGYNPWPNQCVRIVREHTDAAVKGNHDRRVDSEQNSITHLSDSAKESVEWNKERLDNENREFLAGLPQHRELFDGRVLLSHSDPRYLDAYLFPEEFGNLDRFLESHPVLELVVMGHTHIPHVEEVSGVVLVNPGSVGQPRDGDPRSSYAIIDVARSGDVEGVDLCRVDYNVDTVVEGIRGSTLPDRFAERLKTGD